MEPYLYITVQLLHLRLKLSKIVFLSLGNTIHFNYNAIPSFKVVSRSENVSIIFLCAFKVVFNANSISNRIFIHTFWSWQIMRSCTNYLSKSASHDKDPSSILVCRAWIYTLPDGLNSIILISWEVYVSRKTKCLSKISKP